MRAPPAGPGLPEGPSPVAPGRRPGQRQPAWHRPAAGDLHRPPMPPPAFRRERRPPRPLAGQPALLLLAPTSRRRKPGRDQSLAGHTICPSGSWTGRPAQARMCGSSRVRAPAPRQALSAPYQPPLPRGRGHCLAEPDPGLTWLASTSPESGYGPDLCPYRQPGATGCRACRMFPIACYGLTPRCREVKR